MSKSKHKKTAGQKAAQRSSMDVAADEMNAPTSVGDDGPPDPVPQSTVTPPELERTGTAAAPDPVPQGTAQLPDVEQIPTAPVEPNPGVEAPKEVPYPKEQAWDVVDPHPVKPSWGRYFHRCRVVKGGAIVEEESFEIGRSAPDKGRINGHARTPAKITQEGSEIVIEFAKSPADPNGVVIRLVNVPVELEYKERPVE